MLAQLNPWKQMLVKFESEFYHCHSIKCIRICRLPKWRPFCRVTKLLGLPLTYPSTRPALTETMKPFHTSISGNPYINRMLWRSFNEQYLDIRLLDPQSSSQAMKPEQRVRQFANAMLNSILKLSHLFQTSSLRIQLTFVQVMAWLRTAITLTNDDHGLCRHMASLLHCIVNVKPLIYTAPQ